MKQIVNYLLLASLFVAGLTGLAACSSNDDDSPSPAPSGNLETPKYESVSAKYTILSEESDIRSVELTESGNYVIVKRGYNDVKAAQAGAHGKSRLLQGLRAMTRSNEPDIIEGKYTKISDTEFNLEGFGTITITGSANNAVTLVVTPKGGTAFTLQAARTPQKSNSVLTTKLCRTWKISSIRIQMSFDGDELMNSEHKIGELNKFEDDYIDVVKKMFAKQGRPLSAEEAEALAHQIFGDGLFDEDFSPTQVIFTKAGSYMVQYKDGELALSTWAWIDEPKGIMHYSWNYENFEDDMESGEVYVSFRGAQLAVRETYPEDEVVQDVTIYFDEVK